MDPSVQSAGSANPYTSLVSPGMHNMPVVNFNNIMNVKDSRWLQLEVCREFQRNKCTRPDTECKFAHPPSTVEVQNGRVTACYDSIKGRCNREKPPCKYFHPPQHLKDQLLINGRNHLALKNAFMTQIQSINPATQHTQLVHPVANTPYMTGVATMPNYNPYLQSQPVMTVGVSDAVAQSLNNVCPQQVISQQKIARTDRLEAFPGMGIPYKRPAPEKSGLAVYQPGSAAYHQALMHQIGGQGYVPVSCEYGGGGAFALPQPTIEVPCSPPANPSASTASEPPSSSIITTTYSSSAPASPPVQTTTATTSPVCANVTALAAAAAAAASNSSSVAAIPSPSLPVNVFSYTGVPINKSVRPAMKAAPQNLLPTAGTGLPSPFPTAAAPSFGGVGNVGYGMPVPGGYGLHYPNNLSSVMPTGASMGAMGAMGAMGGMGGMVHPALQMAMPGMANANMGFPMQSYPLMYSQYPASSFVLPQLNALASNPPSSWAQQATEQPYKKLKTS